VIWGCLECWAAKPIEGFRDCHSRKVQEHEEGIADQIRCDVEEDMAWAAVEALGPDYDPREDWDDWRDE
jgi:hypothetical protein